VQSFLRSRGVSTSEAEDISQEVALRALLSGVTFTDADDLVPWACTVAWRVHIGLMRRRRARPIEVALDTDRPSFESVEEEVAARLHLLEVLGAVSRLGDRDRGLLLETLDEDRVPRASKEAGRAAVLRHRARTRLLKSLGGVAVVLGVVINRLRVGATVSLLTAATAAVILALPHGQAGHGPVATPATVAQPSVDARLVPVHPAPVPVVVSRLNRTSQPAVSAASVPPPVFIVRAGTPGSAPIGVAARTRTASDHLLCTGSFILLPHLCVG
jgi:DNA-directed RNA polymerase specialized sigma24 family protein